MESTKQYRVIEIFFRGLRGEDLSVQELANEYAVSTKSITRSINELKNFLADHRELVGNTELEFHTEYETSLRHAIQGNLKENDALFFVIQDFEILANGNAITECIRTVRMEQGLHKGVVLISHKNPVYNMAIIHAQTTEGKLKEETMFYNSLTTKFPSLVDEVAKKRINNILRT